MNISVTDNRTITVVINGTEHKLSIKDAEALRDALVKALPASVPRAEYADIGEITPFEEFFTPYSTSSSSSTRTRG